MPKKDPSGWIAYRGGGQVLCAAGPQHQCHNFSLMIARNEDIQPANLREASGQINEILDKHREDREGHGRRLVLLETSLEDGRGGHGLLLAYARRSDEPPLPGGPNAVTADSEEGDIKDALGI
jgi:hypothetical protein